MTAREAKLGCSKSFVIFKAAMSCLCHTPTNTNPHRAIAPPTELLRYPQDQAPDHKQGQVL